MTTKTQYRITYGADPEYFICDQQRNIVAASGRIPGGKGKPYAVSVRGLPSGWGILADGAALEINTPAYENPIVFARDYRRFIQNLGLVLAPFNLVTRAHMARPGSIDQLRANVFPRFHASIEGGLGVYPEEDVQFLGPAALSHPDCQVLGCAPDEYLYGDRPPVNVNLLKQTRFAGGHLHIGIDPWPENLPKQMLVRYLDLRIYPLLARLSSAPSRRIMFYGFPGLYRETKYGVEYRSPSNGWWAWAERGLQFVGEAMEELRTYLDKPTDVINAFVESKDAWGGYKFQERTIKQEMDRDLWREDTALQGIIDILTSTPLIKMCDLGVAKSKFWNEKGREEAKKLLVSSKLIGASFTA